jgi:hypothetical protein
MIMPGVQKPHWVPSFSWKARCRRDRLPAVARPSMVSTLAPSTLCASVLQARRGSPSTSTVQAPHSPPSQPCLVPVRPSALAQVVDQQHWLIEMADALGHGVFAPARRAVEAVVGHHSGARRAAGSSSVGSLEQHLAAEAVSVTRRRAARAASSV